MPLTTTLNLTDPTLRRGALTTITTHLTTRTLPLTPTQALQLQKGFFFALYMHDSKSPISVQNLIATLADLTVSAPSPAVAVPLIEAFWSTMAREWTSIDAHRMDKYLLFVRTVVRRVFAGIAENASGGKEGKDVASEEQMALMEKFPLSPRERKVPDGLRYHVLDVYVDELERAVGQEDDEGEDEEEISEETRKVAERLLAPVEKMAKEGLSKGVRVRAKEVLADERVVRWRTKGELGDGGGEEDGQDEWGGLD
jgi:ribosomal RNA-processing protein 1